MPKSIIREFDNSTTGSILSSNFSVLVPGYMNPEKDTEELKELAIKYQSFDIEPEAPDIIGDFLIKLGQKE